MTRHRLLCLSLLGILAAAAPQRLRAQAPAPPGVFVLSQNRCAYGTLSQLNALVDTTVAPVLNELVAEGRLHGWGLLEHSWGDEWNWNLFYTATSHRAFLDAFDEFARRVSQRHPTAFERLVSYCTDHRDNIYGVHAMRMRS